MNIPNNEPFILVQVRDRTPEGLKKVQELLEKAQADLKRELEARESLNERLIHIRRN